MKALKTFAIALLTFGAASTAKAQVSISVQFGQPLLPIYSPAPVIVERPVVYARPVVYTRRAPAYRRNVVVVNRPAYRTRTVVVNRPPVYHNRTIVVNRPAYHKVKVKHHKKGHGYNKHVKTVRYARY